MSHTEQSLEALGKFETLIISNGFLSNSVKGKVITQIDSIKQEFDRDKLVLIAQSCEEIRQALSNHVFLSEEFQKVASGLLKSVVPY